MKKALLLFVTCWFALTPAFAQYGLLGGDLGFGPGSYSFGDAAVFEGGAGSSRTYFGTVTGNGDTFFRLLTNNNNGNMTDVGPANCGSNDDVTGRMAQVVQGSGCNSNAFRIANVNTAYTYVLKTPTSDNSYEFIWFEVQGAVEVPGPLTQSPQANGDNDVPANTPVTITGSTVSGNGFPTGQALYLRYTTNNFMNSTVIPFTPVSNSQGSNQLQATIPGQADEAIVTYYAFTSGSAVQPDADGSDADYRAFNLENNNGLNYNYSVERALPVTLSAWTGQREKDDVLLRWSTATERGASHFTVECSADGGGSWMERGRVSADNLPSGTSYRFRDSNVPVSDLHYRLRQVDLDGSEEFSPLLLIEGKANELRLWPQPAPAGGVLLDVSLNFLGADAQLLDANGRALRSFVIDGPRFRLPTEQLRPGVYFLVVRGEQLETRRVVIGQ